MGALQGMFFLVLFVCIVPNRGDDGADRWKVGMQPDGRIVVPTNQILQPAGRQIVFPGRPVDLITIDSGRTLVVKDMHELIFIDLATGAVKQRLSTPKRGK